MLLLQKQVNIHLTKSIQKINYLCTAYGNTLLLSARVEGDKIQAIIHLNKLGQILGFWQYKFEIGCCGIIGGKQVIILNRECSYIEIISLQGYSLSKIKHQFMQFDTQLIDLFIFHESKQFCIVQKQIKAGLLRVTYYGWQEGRFIKVGEFQDFRQKWSFSPKLFVLKGNENSKIIWLEQFQRHSIDFKTYDLKEGFKSYHIENKFQYLLTLRNMWQIKKDVYSIICNIGDKTFEQQPMNSNNIIINTELGLVQQANYPTNQKTTLFKNQVLHTLFLKNHTLFFICRQNNIERMSPLIFVDNKTQRIVKVDAWMNSLQTKIWIHDNSVLIAQFDTKCISVINLRVMRMSEMKEITLHFMLHLNDNFADDLLQDAIELLPYQ